MKNRTIVITSFVDAIQQTNNLEQGLTNRTLRIEDAVPQLAILIQAQSINKQTILKETGMRDHQLISNNLTNILSNMNIEHKKLQNGTSDPNYLLKQVKSWNEMFEQLKVFIQSENEDFSVV